MYRDDLDDVVKRAFGKGVVRSGWPMGLLGGLVAVPLMIAAPACGESETTPVHTGVTDTADVGANDVADDETEPEPDAVSVDGSVDGCTTGADCEDGKVCRAGRCMPECATNDDCAEPRPVCDTSIGLCVEFMPACPVAVITVAEGEGVMPQTLLHLSAASSYAPGGAIAEYKWGVTQPAGSTSTVFPSGSRPDVTFDAHALGVHTFTLDVWDTNGVKSCVPASFTVAVEANIPLRVELVWTTPGDPDETDTGPGVGSDLDLHFVSPGGEFFDDALDLWAGNTAYPLGSRAPRLDRSDEDGGGPETINFDAPTDGETYRVGVHYVDDFGFGVAHASLRVYVHGQLTETWEDVELAPGETWDALEIKWPDGVTRTMSEGGPLILTGLGQ